MGHGPLAAAGDLGSRSQLCIRTLADTLPRSESNNQVLRKIANEEFSFK